MGYLDRLPDSESRAMMKRVRGEVAAAAARVDYPPYWTTVNFRLDRDSVTATLYAPKATSAQLAALEAPIHNELDGATPSHFVKTDLEQGLTAADAANARCLLLPR